MRSKSVLGSAVVLSKIVVLGRGDDECVDDARSGSVFSDDKSIVCKMRDNVNANLLDMYSYGVLFENRPALFFNYIFISAYKIYFFLFRIKDTVSDLLSVLLNFIAN